MYVFLMNARRIDYILMRQMTLDIFPCEFLNSTATFQQRKADKMYYQVGCIRLFGPVQSVMDTPTSILYQ